MRASELRDNVVTGYGGGLFTRYDDSVVVSDTAFVGNRAQYGGGVHVWGTTATLDRVEVVGNAATVSGGGVFCEGWVSGADNVVSSNSPDDVYEPPSGGCWGVE